MSTPDNISDVEAIVTSLLPVPEYRQLCLELFREAIEYAHSCGGHTWGVRYYMRENRVRLLVGKPIIFTICDGNIWLALDKKLLETSKGITLSLENSESWVWQDMGDYQEYARLPSKNGYYTPSTDHDEIWPVIKKAHFVYIKNLCDTHPNLYKPTRKKNSLAVVDFLRSELNQPIRYPDYTESHLNLDLPEEILEPERYFEGTKKSINVNAYERDRKAREACIAYHGTKCQVCEIDLGERYGEVGDGFIHVHHLRPLKDIGEQYEVNPVEDLVPVCPNCHAIIHRREPPFGIDEVKAFLK